MTAPQPAGKENGTSATAIGKRYQCAVCKTMVLCLRPAKALYECCSATMEEVRMQKLPSGD